MVAAALVQRVLLKRHEKILGGTAPGGGSEGQKDLFWTSQAIEGAMLLWDDFEGGQADWLAESTCWHHGATDFSRRSDGSEKARDPRVGKNTVVRALGQSASVDGPRSPRTCPLLLLPSRPESILQAHWSAGVFRTRRGATAAGACFARIDTTRPAAILRAIPTTSFRPKCLSA
jgi:hypothetical protein